MTRAGKQSKNLMRFVAAMLVLSFWAAHAQSSLDDIHVMPRGDVANPDAAGSLKKTASGVIRTTVELVLVPVTVTDRANRIVTGLGRENFHLFEDKHPQLINHVWEEDEPVSLGIVLDVSGSISPGGSVGIGFCLTQTWRILHEFSQAALAATVLAFYSKNAVSTVIRSLVGSTRRLFHRHRKLNDSPALILRNPFRTLFSKALRYVILNHLCHLSYHSQPHSHLT
jgi:hypothetical protein